MQIFSRLNFHGLKLIALSLMTVFVVTACAGQPAYRAAERGGFGYSERQITEEQYRVNFKARGDNIGMAVDYAMLRAAEITLERGYGLVSGDQTAKLLLIVNASVAATLASAWVIQGLLLSIT